MANKFYDFNKPEKPASVFDNTNMRTKFATATAGLSPMADDYTPLFKDVSEGKSPFADFLSKPMGFSSENAMQADNAQNVAQSSKSESSNLMDLHKSLLDLVGGGFNEEDSLGGKWKMSAGGLPYHVSSVSPREHRGVGGELIQDLPEGASRIEAFKQSQIASQKQSEAAASTPSAFQSQANRQALIQSKMSTLPMGASVTETQSPMGTQRTVNGPAGYATAYKQSKKQGDLTA